MKKTGGFLLLSVFAWFLAFPASAALHPDHYDIQIDTELTAGSYFRITVNAKNAAEWIFNDYYDTVTFTAASHDYFDSVTFTAGIFSPGVSGNFGLQQPGQWFGTIQLLRAGGVTLTCVDSYGATGAAWLYVNPGPVTQPLIMIQSQLRTPGLAPGVAPDLSSASSLVEGVFYPVTVYAVDQYWNWNPAYTGALGFNVTGGTYSPTPLTYTVGGKEHFSVQFNVSGLCSLSSYTPVSRTFYMKVNSADIAYIYLNVPAQAEAGVPFSLTATASASDIDPGMVIASINNYSLSIATYLGGNHQTAPAQYCPPITTFTIGTPAFGNGRYCGDFYYKRSDTILLNTQFESGGTIAVVGRESGYITVLPTRPSSLELLTNKNEAQSRSAVHLEAHVRDTYGNSAPGGSAKYPFDVFFLKNSVEGHLSVTRTATDSAGIARCDYTCGDTNELVQVYAYALNPADDTFYAGNTISVRVSLSEVTPGSIFNFPNPFNPLAENTSVNYYLETNSEVQIKIYDAFGRTVFNKSYLPGDVDPVAVKATSAGGASWEWDGRNTAKRVVANGIYLLKVTATSNAGNREFKRRVGVLK